MNANRIHARNLAAESIRQGKPLEWFEKLYDQARAEASIIPWADMKANPNLTMWLERASFQGKVGRALVVGCGLGDDAEALRAAGFEVTAFDISRTCIEWCRRRFPESAVNYVLADLFAPPPSWHRGFQLVLEAYTLQVLPEGLRPAAMRQIADFVSAGGQLLVVTRGRDPLDYPGDMPWPLVRRELNEFVQAGLEPVQFEDFHDAEEPPVRRFRVEYRRC
jgi:SAM-dependent methyltransferase